MKRVALLVLGLLVADTGSSFGIELELTKTRNPFEFGKGGTFLGEAADSSGSSTKQISRLGMVYISGDRKVAIIDGLPYHEGDIIEGSKITSITIEYVELSSSYKTWRMWVEIPEE
ncbi:MAG: hypothetical protein HZA04_10160 [Nitrospinae bacterium]|nr:hypothetical protein [Nitrospinota bacterium]